MSRLRVKTLDDIPSLFGREIALQSRDGTGGGCIQFASARLLIDTRTAEEFTRERVDGALNIPFVDSAAFET